MASKLPQVFSYPEADTLSTSLGTYILKLQDTALQRHPTFRVAISGGSLLEMLVRDPEALLLNPHTMWPQWEIFFADERAVPLDHSDSNYLLFKRTILDKIPSGHRHRKPTVYPIDDTLLEAGDEDEMGVTQEIADAYEQTLVKCFAAKDSVRVPVFDLILLGAGPDGHTASLFPGHALLREDSAWVAAMEDAPKMPPRRITLTLPVLTHANHVVFVATGGGKRDMMRKVFETLEEGLPCSLVNMQAGGDRVAWFVDDEAIEGVQGFVKAAL